MMDSKDIDQPDLNGVFYFGEDVTQGSVRAPIEWILGHSIKKSKDQPKDLKLLINSYGGDLYSAFAIIDVMKGSPIPVHTYGIGCIASAGLLIFMSGAKGHRFVTPNTIILSHQFSWGSWGKEHELFAAVRKFEMTKEKMIAHYQKCTGLSKKKIEQYLLPSEDIWLSPEQAVEFGLADGIKTMY